MSKQAGKLCAQLVREQPSEVILKVAALCDGHAILKPEAFTAVGLPTEIVEHLTRTYRSDGSPRGTLFVNDQLVAELQGVYGLDVLRYLADVLGVKYMPAFGRGTGARNIQSALHRHFQAFDAKPSE